MKTTTELTYHKLAKVWQRDTDFDPGARDILCHKEFHAFFSVTTTKPAYLHLSSHKPRKDDDWHCLTDISKEGSWDDRVTVAAARKYPVSVHWEFLRMLRAIGSTKVYMWVTQ